MASSCPPEAAAAAAALGPPPPQALPSLWAPPAWGSPASSPESGRGSLSPAYAPLGPPAAAAGLPGAGRRAKGGRRGRLADGQRQSASQREKLRMRRLAGALHTLRQFLPPALAPAGQSLTKVQTLRLASRYIAHLAQLLRPPPPPPPPRPTGLACAQPASPRLQPAPPAWALSPAAAAHAAWSADGTHAHQRAGRAAPGAAAAAASPREDLSAQSLPAELLAWLEGFLSPPAHH